MVAVAVTVTVKEMLQRYERKKVLWEVRASIPL
ncbi:MAG: hypothetical protein ETSY1_36935 [Candidatus Entotheonella factor]|uniref:Uncharacterized protein n=1 Tax=Entotheonella factor TaxID=1429438 RepID=W4L7A8_ENTF1|nr:MAG: hypothetical protein ETSY1_36935 [Candidatus Entotheonella factor]